MKWLLILVLFLIETNSIGSPRRIDPITGIAIVEGLRSTALDVVAQAGEQGRALANEIAARLTTIASEVERALGDKITKPINELTATLKVQTDRALVAWEETKNFLSATRTCLKGDLTSLLGSFSSNLTYNVSNLTFWKKEDPIVFNVEKIGSSLKYGLRVGTRATLSVKGANFNFNSRCAPTLEIINLEDNSKVAGIIMAKDQVSVTIQTDTMRKVGLYEIKISYYSKYILGCRQEKVIRTFMSILPRPEFKIDYTIVPICTNKEVIPFNAGRIDDTNDGCSGDRYPEIVSVLPEGLKYVRHEFIAESANGCEKTVDQYLGGTSVRIKYKLPQPSCILGRRTGARTWVHGRLIIYGEKEIQVPSNSVTGSFTGFLSYDQTRSEDIAFENCVNIYQWNVSARITYPDGKVIDIPSMQGERVLTNGVNGVSYRWDPTTKKLSITTPVNPCE